MSQRPIMDAGPGINFFSINRERLLFSTLGPLAVPEIVEQEIRRKARQDQRFAAAARVLNKVPARLLEILSDDVTDDLAVAVHRIAGMPMSERIRSGKDLGETMVVAHAVVAAERGDRVIVIIDDGGGRAVAAREAARLQRLKNNVLKLAQSLSSAPLLCSRKPPEVNICRTKMRCDNCMPNFVE